MDFLSGKMPLFRPSAKCRIKRRELTVLLHWTPRAAAAFAYGNDDRAELPLELGLVEDASKLIGHRTARQLVHAAAERAKHNAVMAVQERDPADGANLVQLYCVALRRESAVFGHVLPFFVAVAVRFTEAQRRHRDHGAVEGLFAVGEHAVLAGTEKPHARRVDAAEGDVERVGVHFLGHTRLPHALERWLKILVERLAQRRGPAQVFLLGTQPRIVPAAGMTARREIEDGRIEPLSKELHRNFHAVLVRAAEPRIGPADRHGGRIERRRIDPSTLKQMLPVAQSAWHIDLLAHCPGEEEVAVHLIHSLVHLPVAETSGAQDDTSPGSEVQLRKIPGRVPGQHFSRRRMQQRGVVFSCDKLAAHLRRAHVGNVSVDLERRGGRSRKSGGNRTCGNQVLDRISAAPRDDELEVAEKFLHPEPPGDDLDLVRADDEQDIVAGILFRHPEQRFIRACARGAYVHAGDSERGFAAAHRLKHGDPRLLADDDALVRLRHLPPDVLVVRGEEEPPLGAGRRHGLLQKVEVRQRGRVERSGEDHQPASVSCFCHVVTFPQDTHP